MRELDYKKAYKDLLTPEIVSFIGQIREQKGQQNLFVGAHQDMLDELLEIAKIQSTDASNRLEGIYTSDARLRKLVLDKTRPQSRKEEEIAGYRDVLTIIHENYDYIPVKPGSILQLHRDLYKYANVGIGGQYKNGDNVITEELPDGTKRERFVPVSAWETPEAMDRLCQAFDEALRDPEKDPLLLIPMFILDFLCIHPFGDGNGRLSRLLTLLLLYRSGFVVGKYISLEKLISDTKTNYYDALEASSFNWHEGANDYLPFVRYILGIIVAAYREFASRVNILTTVRIPKPDRVREIIRNTAGKITKSEIMEQCPDISQVTVERTLRELQDSNRIIKIGGGRYTSYTWNWEEDNT